MAVPAYLWLYDASGALIIGDCNVLDRVGAIELQSFNHGVHVPFDGHSGSLAGTRVHDLLSFTKEFDKATPYLYRATAQCEKLQKAIIKWYRINDAGIEEEFMHMILEKVRVIGVTPVMHNFKSANQPSNPTESISLGYQRITWKYLDGNIQYTDEWNNRTVY
jgi:type VI secretion system Hcp family effector